MKKTLVALAALAATGAFAQVTITGEYAYGYQTTTGPQGAAKTAAGGLGFDTSAVWFDAKEDLGGGMSIASSLGMIGLDRSSGGVVGLDGKATLTTGVGAFTLGSIKSADFVKGYSNVGGTWYSLDGQVTPARTKNDMFGFATKMGSIGFGFQHSEDKDGMGVGAEGSTKQRNNSYTVSYSSGALNAGLGFVQYDNQNQATAFYKDATRVGVNYDFGGFKAGAAFQAVNTVGTAKATVTSVGVTAPMGALSLSANWQSVNVSDLSAAANGSNSGYNLQAQYNLSKQTYVIASYNSYTGRDYTGGTFAIDGTSSSQTNLILVKDF